MRLISEVKEGFVDDWGCYDDYTPDIEVMNDFCEGFSKGKPRPIVGRGIPYLIDEVIGDLEDLGSTKATSWNLCNDSSNSEELMRLEVEFKNGFYIWFGVGRIVGRVY